MLRGLRWKKRIGESGGVGIKEKVDEINGVLYAVWVGTGLWVYFVSVSPPGAFGLVPFFLGG